MKIDTTNNTLKLVLSAIMIAIGTVLSIFKFNGLWAFGGGVTFCAMLPLVIIAHIYGTKWGVFTAFVFSLLQMILGFSNVLYGTSFLMMIAIALLDYIIAYTVIGFSAMFKGRFPNIYIDIVVGIVFTFSIRLLCHFLSGWMIWDALWPNELSMASPIYSIAYNGSYMIPEIIITSIVAVAIQRIISYSKINEK